MTTYTSTSDNLTLYAKQAYGGWTAHIHQGIYQGPQSRWLLQGHDYFATSSEAQASAVNFAQDITGRALTAVHWV